MQGLPRIEEAEKTMNNGLQPYSWYDHMKIFDAGGNLAKISCHSVYGYLIFVVHFLEGGAQSRLLMGAITGKPFCTSPWHKPR